MCVYIGFKVFPPLYVINLLWIFTQSPDQLLKFLAYHDLIKNQIQCKMCSHSMGLIKYTQGADGFAWLCSPCKKRKTIRDGSFFQRSSLPLQKLFPPVYMWIEDFRNKNAVKELQISEAAVVDWFNYCRLEYEQIKTCIGGSSKIIEIDETCWVKQKHNRGKPKKGTHQWYFGCVERGKGAKRSFSASKIANGQLFTSSSKNGCDRAQ